MREKFRNTERHMNDAVKTITSAEDKVERVMLQMGLKSNRVPHHQKESRGEVDKRSHSYPPQQRSYEQRDRQDPNNRYEEEKKRQQVPKSKQVHQEETKAYQSKPELNMRSHDDTYPDEQITPKRQKMIYKDK